MNYVGGLCAFVSSRYIAEAAYVEVYPTCSSASKTQQKFAYRCFGIPIFERKNTKDNDSLYYCTSEASTQLSTVGILCLMLAARVGAPVTIII